MMDIFDVFVKHDADFSWKLRMSPAMAAGIAPTFMLFEDVLARIDAVQAPKVRGPYKPRQISK